MNSLKTVIQALDKKRSEYWEVKNHVKRFEFNYSLDTQEFVADGTYDLIYYDLKNMKDLINSYVVEMEDTYKLVWHDKETMIVFNSRAAHFSVVGVNNTEEKSFLLLEAHRNETLPFVKKYRKDIIREHERDLLWEHKRKERQQEEKKEKEKESRTVSLSEKVTVGQFISKLSKYSNLPIVIEDFNTEYLDLIDGVGKTEFAAVWKNGQFVSKETQVAEITADGSYDDEEEILSIAPKVSKLISWLSKFDSSTPVIGPTYDGDYGNSPEALVIEENMIKIIISEESRFSSFAEDEG